MNNNKTRQGLWLVVGAYLAYTGFTLAKRVLEDKPDNSTLLLVAGVTFVGVGIAVVIRSIKELRKPEEEVEDTADEGEEDIEEEESEEEPR